MAKLTQVKTIAVVAALLGSASAFAEMLLESPRNQTRLLELYTSEGCSSCPPADRWLSKLTNHPDLWTTLVPVGFHVDYWDYIGWKDRFADKKYSDRQRRYADEASMSTIYTPGFILNGREWRNFSWLPVAEIDDIDRGVLRVAINKDDFTARYRPIDSVDDNLVLNVAILGFGIETIVKAGENRGRTLAHDFVVLDYQELPLVAIDDGFSASGDLQKPSVGAERLGIAAWVTTADSQRPLQATGGWLGTNFGAP